VAIQSITTITNAWTQPGCALIVSSVEHTLLFWSLFRQKKQCRLLSFPTNISDFAQWSGELSQSFLGQSTVFFGVVPAVQAKNSKVRQQAIQFLKTYTGPHAVWLLVDEEGAPEFGACRKVAVASTIAAERLEEVAQIFDMVRSVAVVQALAVIPVRTTLSLDTAMQLLLHAGYVPTRNPQPAEAFLQTLLPQEISLVQVAELFFKQNWPEFLKEWAAVSPLYSDMFWISFWTEQLWRAYWVCWYMERGQQTKARSMSYRLPASFTSGGWRHQSALILRAQYEHISFLDTGIKFGSYFSADEAITGLVALGQR